MVKFLRDRRNPGFILLRVAARRIGCENQSPRRTDRLANNPLGIFGQIIKLDSARISFDIDQINGFLLRDYALENGTGIDLGLRAENTAPE
jgi:hypothetical protein